MKKPGKRYFIVLLPFSVVIALALLVNFGTQYTPLYTFDDRTWKRVPLDSNQNANWVRFKSKSVILEINQRYGSTKISDLDDLISLSTAITKERLYYDTATLLNRNNTDMAKVGRQHDVDWLFVQGHANCIGYAYLFAGVFNELKDLHPQIASCEVRIVYESPTQLLFGLIKTSHTWNEVVFVQNGIKKSLHVDANASDYFLPGNVTPFIKHNRDPGSRTGSMP